MSNIQAGSIVVGVDGSEHAERAVRWAAEQAHLQQRRLVTVSVARAATVQSVGWTGEVAGRSPETALAHEGIRAIAEEAAELARAWRPDITVEPLAVVGDAREVLADLSADAHLLVLGSRGRGTIKSLLLGSVSETVSRLASCPVVVCRPPGQGQHNPGVVVGADGTPESLPVIEFAFEQASVLGLPLTVLHCFWDAIAAAAGFREASGEVLSQPDLEELRLVLAESVAGFQEKYPDVDVTLLLRHGLVDGALSPRGHWWDLVVVGRQPLTAAARFLHGSITAAVVERAHSTVAVVPEAASAE